MDRTTALRTLRDVGAAAWFGGSLMGASGLNAAADEVAPADRDRVASAEPPSSAVPAPARD